MTQPLQNSNEDKWPVSVICWLIKAIEPMSTEQSEMEFSFSIPRISQQQGKYKNKVVMSEKLKKLINEPLKDT